jgi:UDP-glucose 4-epimerase
VNHVGTPPQRALVIGWGFVGAAIGRRLASAGADVVSLTRSETAATASARAAGIRILVADAADLTVLADALSRVDHVVVAAGGLLPPSAAAEPLADATATLSPLIRTLEEMRRHVGLTVTYISSGGTVYGNPVRSPVRETDETRPVSPYGASHLAAEAYAGMYRRTYGIPVRIVRCANVYGPGQPSDRNQGVVAVFLERISSGAPIMVLGDGSMRRDYVFVDDVSRAIAQLVLHRIDVDVVNLGSGRGDSVTDVIECVSRVVGRPAVLEFQPARPYDVEAIVLDISKLQSLIPYVPTSLEDGLQKTWDSRRMGRSAIDAIASRNNQALP